MSDTRRILLTGASGLIGSRLVPALETDGWEVWKLTRSPQGARELGWDLEKKQIDLTPLQKAGGAEAVIHLAGENIADGRWTAAKKRRIRESRVQGTTLLVNALVQGARKPSVFLSASGINYYPSDTGLAYDEEGPRGKSFLSEVCIAWEEAAKPLQTVGARVIWLRTGMVLAGEGGALPRLVQPFKLGMGGPVGDGEQHISWIALDDYVALVRFCLATEAVRGPVNTVAPKPVRNADFAHTLGKVLHKPARLPAPTFAVKAMLGREAADELVLADMRIVPVKASDLGFAYNWGDLEKALRHELRGLDS